MFLNTWTIPFRMVIELPNTDNIQHNHFEVNEEPPLTEAGAMLHSERCCLCGMLRPILLCVAILVMVIGLSPYI